MVATPGDAHRGSGLGSRRAAASQPADDEGTSGRDKPMVFEYQW